MTQEKKTKVIRNPSPDDLEKVKINSSIPGEPDETKLSDKKATVSTDVNLKEYEEKEDDTNSDNPLKPKISKFEPKSVPHKLVMNRENYEEIKHIDEKNQIWIRRMTAVEEDFFYSIMDKLNINNFFEAINKTLTNCVRSNINIYKLNIVEKLALFIHIHALTYGQKQTFKFDCIGCDKEYEVEIDLLKDVKINYMPKSFKFPIKIKLETYDNPIDLYLKYPAIEIENLYLDESKKDWLSKLRILIDKIEGLTPDGEPVTEDDYDEIIINLDKKDIKTLTKKMEEISSFGVDLKDIEIKLCKDKGCELWNKKQFVTLPFEQLFFNMIKSNV